jgi:hypothetical protein
MRSYKAQIPLQELRFQFGVPLLQALTFPEVRLGCLSF